MKKRSDLFNRQELKNRSETKTSSDRNSEQSRGEALTHLIGLGEQSVRKSYYPELLTKLEELEQERDRYSQLNATLEQLNEELEVRVQERTQELQAVNAQLRQEIAERQQIEKQLKQAKEAAEEANRNKDKYFAAASHDLLQPMNAARLLVSALRERTLAPADEGLVERVHLALENAEDLINDLLDISRLDQNAITPDLSSMHLNALLHSLDAEFQPVAQVKKLKLNILPTSLAVCSDSRLLMRILRNLISNAIRYTPEGKITVGCRRTSEHVLIQVWDTGDGIPADQLEMIFKEFQQLDQHRGKNRQGLGLGLAIVDRIARMLGHPVQVASVERQGSCFSVRVPRAHFQPRVPTSLPPASFRPSGDVLFQRSVLVIDNEESILVSMEALLQQWGCQLICAPDLEEALALCEDEEFEPEVILADFHLHDNRTGTEAIAALRQHYQREIPAIVLTADRNSEQRKRFNDANLPVLNKPVKPGKLRALIQHLLES